MSIYARTAKSSGDAAQQPPTAGGSKAGKSTATQRRYGFTPAPPPPKQGATPSVDSGRKPADSPPEPSDTTASPTADGPAAFGVAAPAYARHGTATRPGVLQLANTKVILRPSQTKFVKVTNVGSEQENVGVRPVMGELHDFRVAPKQIRLEPQQSGYVETAFKPKNPDLKQTRRLTVTLSANPTKQHVDLELVGQRDAKADAEDLLKPRPVKPPLDSDKAQWIQSISTNLTNAFRALEIGISGTEEWLRKKPTPPTKSGWGPLLQLAVAATLKGVATPFGSVVAALVAGAHPHAHKDLSSALGRMSRKVVETAIRAAIAQVGRPKETSDSPDLVRNFLDHQLLTLNRTKSLAQKGFIFNVAPTLRSADKDYLSRLDGALQALADSRVLMNAQRTKALLQWANFLARMKYGTWGMNRNVDDFRGSKQLGWGRWYKHGVLKVSVRAHPYSDQVAFRRAKLEGVSAEAIKYLRAHVAHIGDMPVHTFVRFTAEHYVDQKDKRHHYFSPTGKGPVAKTFTADFVKRIDGTINLTNTPDFATAWLAHYSGLVRYPRPKIGRGEKYPRDKDGNPMRHWPKAAPRIGGERLWKRIAAMPLGKRLK
jgi:hypothetical protein